VEDYSDTEKMIDTIRKSPADIYLLSAIGDKERDHLRLSLEIRNLHQNHSILFVLSSFKDLASAINASHIPDYVFKGEVTEPEIARFFSRESKGCAQRNLLVFTSENQKHILGTQTIIAAQADGKKVMLRASDRAFQTALTIAELERILPLSFIRIDKGVIINSDYIRRFDPVTNTLSMIGGQSYLVSRRGQNRLFEKINMLQGRRSK
jgi:DNA-binding LytR/AlgR family response regulator